MWLSRSTLMPRYSSTVSLTSDCRRSCERTRASSSSKLKGFGEVVVGAEIEALDAVLHRVARAQDEHRLLEAALAPLAQQVEAIAVGQTEVEDDEVVSGLAERVARLAAGARAGDRVGALREPLLEELRRGAVGLRRSESSCVTPAGGVAPGSTVSRAAHAGSVYARPRRGFPERSLRLRGLTIMARLPAATGGASSTRPRRILRPTIGASACRARWAPGAPRRSSSVSRSAAASSGCRPRSRRNCMRPARRCCAGCSAASSPCAARSRWRSSAPRCPGRAASSPICWNATDRCPRFSMAGLVSRS